MAETFEPAATNLDGASLVSRGPLADFFHHFIRNKSAVGGFLIVFVLTCFAATGVHMTSGPDTAYGEALNLLGAEREKAPLDPNQTNLKAQLKGPFETAMVDDLDDKGNKVGEKEKLFLLGSDQLGRDVALRLWAGSSVSLLVGFLVVGISVIIGILVGGIAGFYGRGMVQLPFIVTVLSLPLGALFGTIEAWGLGAPIMMWTCYGLGFASLLLQIATSLFATNRKPLLYFVGCTLVFG
ncbi:MAG: hypothetical protein KDB07_07875, partial [Planctomycetes bacterium]|nr:hypothetical protein [Planctomycetota bacterium]